MGVSTTRVVLISLFLLMGMLLPGLIWQPDISLEAWSIQESAFPINSSSEEKAVFLLNYAILAPSIYNTQPWKFNVSGEEILISADESRWLTYADKSKREMYLAIGRSLENLIIAADHFGYKSTVSYFPDSDSVIARVRLEPAAISSMDPRLFPAITASQMKTGQRDNASPNSTPSSNPEPIPSPNTGSIDSPFKQHADDAIDNSIDSEAISALSQSQGQDIQVILTDDPDIKRRFLDLTIRADKLLYSDVNFKSELGRWISQGGMGATGLQAKTEQLRVALLDSAPGQIEKDTEIISNSPYLGFITSKENDVEAQVRAGQVLERISLLASSYGLSLYPMGQSLQAEDTYSEVGGLLQSGSANSSIVQQAFCLTAARTEDRMTPRRPLEEVMRAPEKDV